MTLTFSQLNAIVTGAASGLGFAVAQRVVEAGGRVALCDTNADVGQQSAEQLGSAARFVQTDVASDQSVSQSVDAAMDYLGSCQLLVNCAGIGHSQRVLGKQGAMNVNDFSRVVNVNLNGSFRFCHALIQHMQHNPEDNDGQRGVMINTASIAAFEGQIGQSAYAASKGGIVSLTLPLAREFARFGVRVMAIAPGLFDTPMFQNLPQDAKESLLSQLPFPTRAGQPSEFAALVQHIVENPMLNGEVIRLDGALRMNG